MLNDFLWRGAAFAQGAEAEGVVALGEADAGLVEHERGVVVARGRRAEGAEDEELAERAFHEVGAADDLGNAKIGVVDGAGELVAGHAVFAPDEKVAEIAAGRRGLRAERGVVEGERFPIGHAQAPVDGECVTERRERRVGGRTKLRWVNGLVGFSALVGRADGFEHVATRARTREDLAGGVELSESGAIKGEAFALGNDRFLPSEAEPAKVLEHGGDEIQTEADGVEVVVAEEQRATGGAGALGGDPEGTRVPEMEVAGGRRGEPADIRRPRRRVEG